MTLEFTIKLSGLTATVFRKYLERNEASAAEYVMHEIKRDVFDDIRDSSLWREDDPELQRIECTCVTR